MFDITQGMTFIVVEIFLFVGSKRLEAAVLSPGNGMLFPTCVNVENYTNP